MLVVNEPRSQSPPNHAPIQRNQSAQLSVLVGNGYVGAGSTLVLAANEVADLLVLGLLNGRLVVLSPTSHPLLHEVDA